MSKRELVEVALEEYGFSFDVVRHPEEAVADQLALASPETGLITRLDYQNFLYSISVLNLERLFHFISEASGGEPENQIHLRNLVEEKVYTINPAFDPAALVITKSGLIKPALTSSGTPLVENSDWEKISGLINPFISLEEIPGLFNQEDDEDVANPEVLLPPESVPFPTVVPTVRKTWDRTNIELEIRVFSKNDESAIFGNIPPLPDELTYKVFIIGKCIVKSNDVFRLIDSMGLPEEVPIQNIVEELYTICIDVNPFLKVKEINLKEINLKDAQKVSPPESVRRTTRGRRNKKSERKSSLQFKDVSKSELLTLSDRVKSKVIGQDRAIDQIIQSIQIASCGLRDENKPIGSYLLCGKTGIGKSLTAKVLSEELCRSSEAIVRVDCSEYSEAHSVQRLIGAPPSYVGYEDGGYLTNAVQEYPFSIVLFDEIEKAHPKLFNILLQIMDDARLTDGKGTTVSFKDCLILLTSNIGVAEADAVKNVMGFGDESVLTEEKQTEVIKRALKKKFSPEFLNRLDDVISFQSLSKDDAFKIVDLLLAKLALRLARKSVAVEFTEAVRGEVFRIGFSTKYGARPLERAIEREITNPVAKMILRGEIPDGSSIKVDFKKDKLSVKVSKGKLAGFQPAARA